MKKMIIVLIVIMSSSIVFAGEVYRWKDANGVTRFTNTAPPPNAQVIGTERASAPQPPVQPEKTDYKIDRASLDQKTQEEKERRDRAAQLEIERQKTIQKSLELQAEKEKTSRNTMDNLQRTIETTGRNARALLGVP